MGSHSERKDSGLALRRNRTVRPGPEDISARTKPGPGKWFLMVLRWVPGEGLGVRPQVLQTNCGVGANPACARDRSLTILFVY